MTYVLPLSAIGLVDADRFGRKAAVLGELMAVGFTVPPGFGISAAAVSVGVDGLADEVGAALAELGDGPVAVRSSGVDEDRADMSFAGQYESVLDVSGLDAVLDAIRTCWASATSERVAAYHGVHSGPAPMGVLVQSMVRADAAGVAFSTNPLTGDATEAVVNAVPGLGDRLVAGEVTAEEWLVRGDATGTAGGALDAGQALEVAALARRIADHFQAPQDIEWAFAGGTLWLLQARPITALPEPSPAPVPIDIEVPPGYSTRNQSLDWPWRPFERSVFLPVFSAAARHIFAYTTGATPTAQAIGGWVYVTMPPDTPEAFAARRERIAAEIADGRPHDLVRLWHESWKPAYAATIADLRAIDLTALSDVELQAHLRGLIRLFDQLHDRYFQLTGAAIAVFGQLMTACVELLGWSSAQGVRLRSGMTGDHMAAAVGLSELARLAAGRPGVRRWLSEPDADPAQLSDVDHEFAAAFGEYVARYGHRSIGFDLSEPTLAEQPGVLLALIREQVAKPYDFTAERAAHEARKSAALAEAYTALADRPPADRDRFESAFTATVSSSPVRDEKVYYAVSVWALLRYAVLEIGRRLVDRGQADRVDDALFLELTEALAALAGGADQRERIQIHRGQHAWALANPGPPSYGDPPPAPPGADFLTAGPGTASRDDGTLHGLPASAGRYLGPVRVIRNITEFGKLRSGDVLVCPETTAQWSLLFPSVGALVTDRGSMLSHPAIIAREYGVPAVVATGDATSVLRDGQLVQVDGAAGVVRVISAVDAGRAAA